MRCCNLGNCALKKLHTFARASVQASDGRAYIYGCDRGRWIDASESFSHSTFAAAYLKNAPRIGNPGMQYRGELIEVNEETPVNLSNISLVRSKELSDEWS